MPRFVATIALAVCSVLVASSAQGADDSHAAAESPKFETDVRSIFKTHCFHCHGEEEELSGGLDLRLVRLMKTGGDSGEAIVPGDVDTSLLIHRLRDGDMPPDESKQISPEELKVIENWIRSGAATVRPEPESAEELDFITPEELSHWAYQPIVRPAVPDVKQAASCNGAVDRFILQRLEAAGRTFSPPASAATINRRLHYVLHGLAYAPEVEAAPRELIDQLLASPRYGERWARHWLDVAGYADSEGYSDADVERPDAWRYRDYVIRSLAEDKPYDQFLLEQLAGDELTSSPLNDLSTEEARLLTATGFLRMAPDGTASSVPDVAQARNDCVADTIKIVTSSVMAMTVGCAQCHDHRYDPISQVDYYAFRAIFEPALDVAKWRRPRDRRLSLYREDDRKKAAQIEAEAKKILDDRTKKQTAFINATFEKELAELPAEIHELARKAHATTAKNRTDEQKALFKKHPNLNVTASSLYLYDSKADKELKALSAKATEIRGTKPTEGFVRATTEVKGRVPPTRLFARGDHEQPKQEVGPDGLSVVNAVIGVASFEEVSQTEDPRGTGEVQARTSGRRLKLARWLTDRRNPLTARVIVNRVWAHHFGRGLVTSVSDFGKLGSTPTHPELLDWLAAELIDNDWSLKHLHRLILNSATWQQQLRAGGSRDAVDPDNELYGGASLMRVDAESLRDTILEITGDLNDAKFGPAVPVMADRVGRIVIGKENLNAGRPGKKIDMKSEDLRRSIYIQVRRSRQLSMLGTFDQPVMTPNCDRRRPSTVSTQSLLMLNSDQMLDRSYAFADRLLRDNQEDLDSQIGQAWKLAYGRTADSEELAAAKTFVALTHDTLGEQKDYQPSGDKPPKKSARRDALAVMCQMLLSSNEFLYID